MSNLKRILSLLPEPVQDAYLKKKHAKQLKSWIKNNKPTPPPHIVKQEVINSIQRKYGTNILIETGTYLGDMVYAQRNNFEQIYSIELSDHLAQKAKKRFKKNKNITILQGDSGIVLKELLPDINEGVIFWLDGHYSGGITALGEKECPIIEEIKCILDTQQEHVVLIDDAKDFHENENYPSENEIYTLVKGDFPNSTMRLENNIFCIEFKR